MSLVKNYFKNCPVCGGQQSYTTQNRLNTALNENWVCNKCSITHQKKIYDNSIIEKIVKNYINGVSVSKIASTMKIGKNNVKNILIKNNVWIQNRDKRKKIFRDDEVNDIIYKYVNENLSCETIGNYYNVSKQSVIRLLKEKGVLKKGLSDGVKIELTEGQKEEIKILYLNEYKNSKEISEKMGLTKHFIDKFLSKCEYRRNVSEGVSVGLVKRWGNRNYNDYINSLSEFKEYKRKVLIITNKQPIHTLLNYDKRGLSGVKGKYHLDHKYSILEGFINKISPDIIGNIRNLEFIPWEENLKKRTKNSITINELIS